MYESVTWSLQAGRATCLVGVLNGIEGASYLIGDRCAAVVDESGMPPEGEIAPRNVISPPLKPWLASDEAAVNELPPAIPVGQQNKVLCCFLEFTYFD